ncbi:MAG TPA: hypothetical protein VM409_01380 [Chloroflexia bacterium]|nr:hypothetical protein [Chloroflexia bacterium]
MNDYDFYLRHASISSGEWSGFPLAWNGLAGVTGLAARPHTRWRPWLPGSTTPDNPAAGSWGGWQWRLEVAMLDGLVGLQGSPLADGRGAGQIREDLLAYLPLPAIELKDVDGEIYTVRMTAYSEHLVEAMDAAHQEGGWTATVEFTQEAA